MDWGYCPSSDKAASCTNHQSGPCLTQVEWAVQLAGQSDTQVYQHISNGWYHPGKNKNVGFLIEIPFWLLLTVQNQGRLEFLFTLVYKRKSRNASKHRQIPTCSQGLPHWPHRHRRAFAVVSSGDKHGPAVTAAQNKCSPNTFKYPGGISQMRAWSP